MRPHQPLNPPTRTAEEPAIGRVTVTPHSPSTAANRPVCWGPIAAPPAVEEIADPSEDHPRPRSITDPATGSARFACCPLRSTDEVFTFCVGTQFTFGPLSSCHGGVTRLAGARRVGLAHGRRWCAVVRARGNGRCHVPVETAPSRAARSGRFWRGQPRCGADGVEAASHAGRSGGLLRLDGLRRRRRGRSSRRRTRRRGRARGV